MLFVYSDRYNCRLDLGGGPCPQSIDPLDTLGLRRHFRFCTKDKEGNMRKATFMDNFMTENFFKLSFDLHIAAIDAFEDQHYLESGVIYFQLVEVALRVAIHFLARKQKASESAIERIEKEQSFYQLILFLDLIKPDNGLSEKLMDFNKHRNSFMHSLFFRKSPDSLEEDLKAFCLEGKDLFDELRHVTKTIRQRGMKVNDGKKGGKP